MRTIEWKDGSVITIDQTLLPDQEVWIEMKSCSDVAEAIKEMKISGAPLIGLAAAYGLALTAYHSKAKNREEFMREIEHSAQLLKKTRPTAVNLFWAIERVLKKAEETKGDLSLLKNVIVEEAKRMADEDVMVNRKIGEHGSKLISDGDTILTHCNAGRLATVDYGTALAVIRAAWEEDKKIRVIASETRPKLQGARLTAYELIPVSSITREGFDNLYAIIQRIVAGGEDYYTEEPSPIL